MRLREILSGWFSRQEKTQIDHTGVSVATAAAEEAERWCVEAAQHVAHGRLPDAERSVGRALECRYDCVEALLLHSAIVKAQGRLEEAADSLALAVHYRPDLAEAHYQLGLIATAQSRDEEAESCLRRALENDPSHAKAHNALGAVLSNQGAWGEAVSCFRRAVAIRPELAPAHSNLGCLLITQLDEFDEGAKHVEEAARLAPDATDVKCNWAMLLQYRGQFREALDRWTELIDTGTLANDATARLDRAMIRLALNDFGAGWDEYERRFEVDRKAGRDFGLPRWNGQSLAEKTILVYAEQGVGDEIMFASCLPDLMAVAGRVIIECSDRLEALFRRSFPNATVHGGRKSDSADWIREYEPVDVQVPIGSLPRQFRRDLKAFPGAHPYLRADPARVEHWRSRLREEGAGPAIGVSWRGGTAATRSKVRSLPPELLETILRRDVTWVNLQHGSTDSPPPLPGLHTFPGVTQDLDELAALMGALDLVVSVANTNVHLAGALGRPVWVLVSHRPEWRYGASGERMPWYPSATLFRRDQHEGWDRVLASLELELELFVAASGRRPASA